jgi:hypothetical protein
VTSGALHYGFHGRHFVTPEEIVGFHSLQNSSSEFSVTLNLST